MTWKIDLALRKGTHKQFKATYQRLIIISRSDCLCLERVAFFGVLLLALSYKLTLHNLSATSIPHILHSIASHAVPHFVQRESIGNLLLIYIIFCCHFDHNVYFLLRFDNILFVSLPFAGSL